MPSLEIVNKVPTDISDSLDRPRSRFLKNVKERRERGSMLYTGMLLIKRNVVK